MGEESTRNHQSPLQRDAEETHSPTEGEGGAAGPTTILQMEAGEWTKATQIEEGGAQ